MISEKKLILQLNQRFTWLTAFSGSIFWWGFPSLLLGDTCLFVAHAASYIRCYGQTFLEKTDE